MRFAYPVTCLVALSLFSIPSFAETTSFKVLEVDGKVLVKTNQGLLPAKVGQTIANGTSLFVAAEAVARLVSADGTCDVVLPTQQVTVVTSAICNIKITPTAIEKTSGGSTSYIAGLAFFGAAAAITATSFTEKKAKSISRP